MCFGKKRPFRNLFVAKNQQNGKDNTEIRLYVTEVYYTKRNTLTEVNAEFIDFISIYRFKSPL